MFSGDNPNGRLYRLEKYFEVNGLNKKKIEIRGGGS